MENNYSIIDVEEIFCISFNQDYTYMILGTEKGFSIFSSSPFQLKFNRGKIIYYFYRFSRWN